MTDQKKKDRLLRLVLITPAYVVTAISFYLSIEVLTGNIGNLEPWRITASVIGSLGFFSLILIEFVKRKKSSSKQGQMT